MSKTPETDFHCWTDDSEGELIAVCKAELCRKLECERDDALSQIAQAEKRAERYCQERDEVREAFKEMWRSGDAFLPCVDAETINRWRKAAGMSKTSPVTPPWMNAPRADDHRF